MSQVIMILNSQGEGTGFLTKDGEITGSAFRAYHFPYGTDVKEMAEKFCREHKGIEFIAGEEREYTFGYEIINDETPQLV